MKHLFTITFLFLATGLFAQAQFEVTKDAQGVVILKGIISRELLQNEASFTWLKNDLSWYTPNTETSKLLTQLKDSIQLVVFLGTWCGDSHALVPQFFKLLDQAQFPESRLTVMGVDRSKLTLGHLSEVLGIKNVPTILVYKNGKEIGRVVEYGKTGAYDKDLAEILAAAKK